MTRSEIRKKFSFVANKMPGFPKPGDCYVVDKMSISTQIKNLNEGAGKIFYIKVGQSPVEGEINLELVSEIVYLSPTKYV